MDSSTTNYPLKVVFRAHTTYPLRLPQHMVSASIRTSPSSMLATTVILNSGSGFNIIRRSALRLGLQRHACLDYKFSPVGDANRNLLQILPADILRILFGSAV